MAAEKTVSVSFRVSARFKALLEAAATREHRSQTNMLEALLFAYCEAEGLEPDVITETASSPAETCA